MQKRFSEFSKYGFYFLIVLFVLLVPFTSSASDRDYVEGEYIVKYKNSENKRTNLP